MPSASTQAWQRQPQPREKFFLEFPPFPLSLYLINQYLLKGDLRSQQDSRRDERLNVALTGRISTYESQAALWVSLTIGITSC